MKPGYRTLTTSVYPTSLTVTTRIAAGMSNSRTLLAACSIAVITRLSTSATSARASAIDSGSARLIAMPRTFDPISDATRSAVARVRLVITTSSPRAANRSAMTRPIPVLPPMMTEFAMTRPPSLQMDRVQHSAEQ